MITLIVVAALVQLVCSGIIVFVSTADIDLYKDADYALGRKHLASAQKSLRVGLIGLVTFPAGIVVLPVALVLGGIAGFKAGWALSKKDFEESRDK